MTYLIIAIIAFPIGVFCGITLMACCIVGKRADSKPPNNYCGEEAITTETPKEHVCKTKENAELIHCMGDEDIWKCRVCGKQWEAPCRFSRIWKEEPNPNHIDNGGFEGFM